MLSIPKVSLGLAVLPSELLLFRLHFGMDSIRGKPDTFGLRLLGAVRSNIPPGIL
jgi:hypothetical protein